MKEGLDPTIFISAPSSTRLTSAFRTYMSTQVKNDGGKVNDKLKEQPMSTVVFLNSACHIPAGVENKIQGGETLHVVISWNEEWQLWGFFHSVYSALGV